MASIETIRRVTISAKTEGVDQAAASLRNLAGAEESVASASQLSERAMESVTRRVEALKRQTDDAYRARQEILRADRTIQMGTAQGLLSPAEGNQLLVSRADQITRNTQAARDMEQMTAAARQMKAAVDPLAHAQDLYNEKLAQYDRLAKAGVISSDLLAKGQSRAADDLAKAQRDYDGKLGLKGSQATNLGYQVNDIVSGIAMGQSPLTILTQQGGQVYQALAGGEGGVAGGLKAVGAIIGPVGAGVGAAAVAFGAAALAAHRLSDEQRELASSLTGVGRGTQATAGQLDRIAKSSANIGHVSVSSARDITAAYASTGAIGTDVMRGLVASTRDASLMLGTDLPGAAKELASAFADPARGVETLNSKFGGFNDVQIQTIRRLAESNDKLAAQKVLLAGLVPSLAEAETRLSAFDRLREGVTRGVSNVANVVAERIIENSSPTAQQRLNDLNQRRQNLQTTLGSTGGGLLGSAGGNAMLKFMDDLADKLSEEIRIQERLRKARADTEQAAKDSVFVGNLTRQISPLNEQIKTTESNLAAIRKQLAAPMGSLNIGDIQATNDSVFALTNALRELQAARRAGGTEGLAAQRQADFAQRTAGFSPYAQQLAEIDRQAEEKRRAARTDREDQSFQDWQRTMRETAQKQYTLQASSVGGAVSQVPELYRQKVLDEAARTGVDANLMAAMLKQESGFNPNAVSKAGAQGIAQFMPATAREYGVNPADPFDSIRGMSDYLAKQQKTFGNDPALLAASYNGGPGAAFQLRDKGTFRSQETADYVAIVTKAVPAATALADAQRDVKLSLDEQNRAVADAEKYLGRDATALERAEIIRRRENEVLRQNLPLLEERKQQIASEAEVSARAAQSLRELTVTRNLEFERAQLGRTDIEQRIATTLKGAGLEYDANQDSPIAAAARLNEQLKITKDLSSDVFKGFVSDLRKGVSATDALHNGLNRVADKLIDMAENQIIASLFGGGKAGGGGLVGNLFGMLGSGGGMSTVAGDTSGFGAIMQGLSPHALGGNLSSGQWNLVGERGPELIAPDPSNRSVVPNDVIRTLAQPAAAPNMNFKVEVHEAPGVKAQVKQTQGPQGPSIRVQLVNTLTEAIHSGELDGPMRQRYGASTAR